MNYPTGYIGLTYVILGLLGVPALRIQLRRAPALPRPENHVAAYDPTGLAGQDAVPARRITMFTLGGYR